MDLYVDEIIAFIHEDKQNFVFVLDTLHPLRNHTILISYIAARDPHIHLKVIKLRSKEKALP